MGGGGDGGGGVHVRVLTLSCLKKHSILSSLKTLLQETRFWKTLGIFFKATLRPSRGSVTDLQGGGGGILRRARRRPAWTRARAHTPNINRCTKWLLPDKLVLLTQRLSFGRPVR